VLRRAPFRVGWVFFIAPPFVTLANMQRGQGKGKSKPSKVPQAGGPAGKSSRDATASGSSGGSKPGKSNEGSSMCCRVLTIVVVLIAIAAGYWFYLRTTRASFVEHAQRPFGTQAHKELLQVCYCLTLIMSAHFSERV
jgi:hypothetical protein